MLMLSAIQFQVMSRRIDVLIIRSTVNMGTGQTSYDITHPYLVCSVACKNKSYGTVVRADVRKGDERKRVT